jgi:transcriptional regulator with XRE-family HTH domain
MEPADMIRTVREAAHLSKRELARRAGTSPAAIVEYESGRRDPNAGTLLRILRAAGGGLELIERRGRLDDARQGRLLLEVLRLAEHLPARPASRSLPYPRFGS